MSENILDQIESYLNQYKEMFGDKFYMTTDKVEVQEIINVPEEQDISNIIPSNSIENELEEIIVSVAESVEENKIVESSDNFDSQDNQTEIIEVINSYVNNNEIKEDLMIWKDSNSLEELDSKINTCMACRLGETRKNFVFGTGNPNADIMVIGEAPGADEDTQGKPFVGRAGQLLTKMLEAINIPREEVFIANIIKCRPPANRRPQADEVLNCEPYLKKQIELIKPKLILSLGLTSVDTLLKSTHKMGEIRGKLLNYEGIQMLVTYHPAALLRNPEWKKLAWEDLKILRDLYNDFKK